MVTSFVNGLLGLNSFRLWLPLHTDSPLSILYSDLFVKDMFNLKYVFEVDAQ